MSSPTNYCYEELSNAVVACAAIDYINAINGFGYRDASSGKKHEPNEVISDVEEFFQGDWFPVLTNLEPDIVREKCFQLAPLSKDKRRKVA